MRSSDTSALELTPWGFDAIDSPASILNKLIAESGIEIDRVPLRDRVDERYDPSECEAVNGADDLFRGRFVGYEQQPICSKNASAFLMPHMPLIRSALSKNIPPCSHYLMPCGLTARSRCWKRAQSLFWALPSETVLVASAWLTQSKKAVSDRGI